MIRAALFSILVSTFASFAQVKPQEPKNSNQLRLRVLLDIVKWNDGFKLSSNALFLDSDYQKSAPTLSCEHSEEINKNPWKLNIVNQNGWYCNLSGNVFFLDQEKYIHSFENKFHYNGKSYFGHIKLRPSDTGLQVINYVNVDDYLSSVVSSEMGLSFPEESLKAQIIAARSYALATANERRLKGIPFDLYATQYDQVYKGVDASYLKLRALVEDTKQSVLKFNNNVLKAYYHSSSGGHSETPEHVWKERGNRGKFAYKAKPNPYDAELNSTKWSLNLSPEIGELFEGVGRIRDIKILKRTPGRRVLKLKLIGSKGSKVLSGSQFRQTLGPGWLKSALFEVIKEDKKIVLSGSGWGHGVGMSQMGAKVMAKHGKKAEEILKFYYPNAHVISLNGYDYKEISNKGLRGLLSAR